MGWRYCETVIMRCSCLAYRWETHKHLIHPVPNYWFNSFCTGKSKTSPGNARSCHMFRILIAPPKNSFVFRLEEKVTFFSSFYVFGGWERIQLYGLFCGYWQALPIGFVRVWMMLFVLSHTDWLHSENSTSVSSVPDGTSSQLLRGTTT